MWRKLTILLFLLVLAQTANALPISEFVHGNTSQQALSPQIVPSSQITSPQTAFSQISVSKAAVTEIEHHTFGTFDTNKPESLFNLPRYNRLCPSLFSSEMQTSPEYLLLIEFFTVKLTSGLFRNLPQPPLLRPWFEQVSHHSSTARLSGWKDGNSLYSSTITYHS